MTQQQPGNELAELLWTNGPALRRTHFPATPFPPFACSAAGASASVREQELSKHHTAMRDLHAAPDDEDAVPWLQHYPDIRVYDDDGDGDTAPLPPEYCSALLSGYSGLPAAAASREDAGASTSHGAVVVPPPVPAVKQQQLPRPSGEGIMNFTFFSKPLQRPQPPPSAAASIPVGVETTVVQTNRLRSTPLFSDQRMAWLQTPPKESRATVAASPPPPPPPPAGPPVPVWQREFAAAAAALPQRLQPEARAPGRPPPPATATTSSVCSDNGDRRQLKRSSGSQQAPEWSVSQEDEDLDVDDEAGGARRSAARSTKRGRTAEVHNMSERRRRDRINEKMRALQELIPNCNKIDKASMLEEAIEYLKTLQLQVQMMSTMGCVSPMLAMQHMQMPPMAAHFHHHHLGAMGFGMGAFDPRLVAAAASAAQFPYPMIPGMPMFGHGHAMQPPFPQQAAAATMGAQMAAGIVVDNDGTATDQPEQQTPGEHPHVPPRAM